jgi:hypothetical protein
MRNQDAEFDYHRYGKLLAEAVDEPRRLALIDLLVEEGARISWRLGALRTGKPRPRRPSPRFSEHPGSDWLRP